MTWNGTPIGGLTYPDYVTLGGNVAEADFPRFLALATERLRQVTQGASTVGYEAQVNQALTLGINSLNEMGGFTSESIGSYSYTVKGTTDSDVNATMTNALSGTGLTYRGIAWNTAQSFR